MASTRYAAFLRGVSPMNAKMPDLVRAFEAAGFEGVRTVLASGNVVFGARAAAVAKLERRAEEAMRDHLGRTFLTIVRPLAAVRRIVASDAYAGFRLAPRSKRVVTFLRRPAASPPALPVERGGARILRAERGEVYSAYVPGPRGPVFMQLIAETFGDEVTTRTWETLEKVARDAAPARAR